MKFDDDRAYELHAGGFTRGGTEVLCFHLPGPPPLHAVNDEYPSLRRYSKQSSGKRTALTLTPSRRERGQ